MEFGKFYELVWNSGLYFTSDYKSVSPKYGIDNPVMEFRGINIPVSALSEKLGKIENPTTENVVEIFKSLAKTEREIRSYRAEYENACDDLYYGYGYDFWRKSNKDYMPEEIARTVWHRAYCKMANS
jgi:hypothetical protein